MPYGRLPLLLAACAMVALATGCSDLGKPLNLKPESRVSAVSLDFGTVLVGQSAVRTVTVGNIGGGFLSVIASIAGPGYAFVAGGGGFSVPPGGQRTIEVRFSPTDVGPFASTLELGPDCPPVAMLGTGAFQTAGAACTVDPPTVDFGTVAKGSTGTAQFQVHSTGTAPVHIDVVSAFADVEVTAGGGPDDLAPGASKTVTLVYRPNVGGRFTGTIATGPGCPDVAIQGVGITVSFLNDVTPIFNRACSDCHAFYQQDFLVNRVTDGYAPAVRIKPFDLDNSVLYQKITDSGRYGQPMPQVGFISAHEIDVVREWIVEGAPDN